MSGTLVHECDKYTGFKHFFLKSRISLDTFTRQLRYFYSSKQSWIIIIIGQGRAKYHDLTVARKSITCRCRRYRQIIDVPEIEKSLYFVATKFNNCLIIRVVLLNFVAFLAYQ